MARDYYVNFLDYLVKEKNSYTFAYVAKGTQGFYQGIGRLFKCVDPRMGEHVVVVGKTDKKDSENIYQADSMIYTVYHIVERKDVQSHIVYDGNDCDILVKIPSNFKNVSADFKFIRESEVIRISTVNYESTDGDNYILNKLRKADWFLACGISKRDNYVKIGNCEYKACTNLDNAKWYLYRGDIEAFVPFQDLSECKSYTVQVTNNTIVSISPVYKGSVELACKISNGEYRVFLPTIRRGLSYPVILIQSDLTSTNSTVEMLINKILECAPSTVEHTTEGALGFVVDTVLPVYKSHLTG